MIYSFDVLLKMKQLTFINLFFHFFFFSPLGWERETKRPGLVLNEDL